MILFPDDIQAINELLGQRANLDPELCKQIRASILLAGPLTARVGELHLSPPGGDVIGRRRVDTHILALKALGAQAAYRPEEKVFHFEASKGLKGMEILLDEASVTATENAIMAAVTAEGETTLRNATSEPHVQELCHFLNHLGARIEHIGDYRWALARPGNGHPHPGPRPRPPAVGNRDGFGGAGCRAGTAANDECQENEHAFCQPEVLHDSNPVPAVQRAAVRQLGGRPMALAMRDTNSTMNSLPHR